MFIFYHLIFMLRKTFRLLFSLIILAAFGQVYADDLISVYKLAKTNDPQYRAAIFELNALLEEKPQSQSFLLPQLSATGYISDTDQTVTGGIQAGKYNYDSNGYKITATQSVYQKFNFDNLEQADAKVIQAKASFLDAKQSLILRVVTQYFLVLAAKDNLKFANAERKAIKEQLVQTKQRFNVGLIAITDVHEARARYDQTVASEIEAENTLAINQETLHEITGKKHTVFSSLLQNFPLIKPKPANIKSWIKTALTKNANLRKAASTVDVARLEVSKNQSAHYPSLDLVAEYSNDDIGIGSIDTNENEEARVMLQLNVPLYQGGLVSSRTRAAAFRLQQTKELLEKQRRETMRLTRNSYLSVFAIISKAKAFKQALKSTTVALEATQAGFDVGTRTGVDVLNSQRERYRAIRDYTRERYNYILEILKLKYAAGILTENSLLNVNKWLE